MRLLLINPNTSTATTQAMVGIAREALAPGASLEGVTASVGAALITDDAALDTAAREVDRMAATLDPTGLSGAIIAAFGDPGLAALRARLSIPVTGLAEASMRDAAEGGRRFAVVTTTPLLKDAIIHCTLRYGVAAQFACVRFTRSAPEMLMSDPARLQAELYEACQTAIKADGAEAIVIGGGPLAVAARALRTQIGIPLIEPVLSAVRLVQLRLSPRRDP